MLKHQKRWGKNEVRIQDFVVIFFFCCCSRNLDFTPKRFYNFGFITFKHCTYTKRHRTLTYFLFLFLCREKKSA